MKIYSSKAETYINIYYSMTLTILGSNVIPSNNGEAFFVTGLILGG